MLINNYDEIQALTAENKLSLENQNKITHLDTIISKDPYNIQALLNKAFILFISHRDGQAIKVLDDLLAYDPYCVDAYVWLAEFLLFHWADAEQALKILQKASSINPLRGDIHYLMACSYEKQGDMINYVDSMYRVIELEPTWLNPYFSLIEYFITLKKYNEAKAEFNALKKQIQEHFPAPGDEMSVYYEELITGRLMTPYMQERVKQLQTLMA